MAAQWMGDGKRARAGSPGNGPGLMAALSRGADALILLGTLLLMLAAGSVWTLFGRLSDAPDQYAAVATEFGDWLRVEDGRPKLDLNDMTEAQLMEVSGIGEVLAGRIVAWREANGPFRALEDLLQVSGIGEKKLAGLREALFVE